MNPQAKLTTETVLVRKESLSANIGGEVVLMSIDMGKYYGLDQIGGDIWTRLEMPTRLDALCAALAADYAADIDVIERDVVSLLQDMLKHELIEVKI